MQIRHMEANFGRLSHAALDLQPGLNVITAPNESGKSTWCSFIRNMLYGLSTRTRGALADKNRYAPWDGSAMQGRMDLRGGGEDYTVLRTTRRANAPMGEFACTYYNTATPVPDITGSNLGETLLGVPREVFERSAFIGQSGLAVDQDAELERRIAALITTGEEETSFSETYDRLKKQLNRRRHNKTGQIPALELEMDDLRRSLAVLESCTARVSELQSELEQTAECIAALETAQTQWSQIEQQRKLQRYAQACQTANEAARRAAELEQAAGTLPEPGELQRMRMQFDALQTDLFPALKAQQSKAQEAQQAAAQAKARCAAHPLYPVNDEALQARAAALSEPSVPSVVPAVLALLAALAGGVFAGVQLSQAFSPLVWVGFGVCAVGIAAAVWLLTRRGKAQRARQAAAESRAALDRQIEEYLPLRRAMQDAEDAARQAVLSVDVYEQSCQNRARQLLRALQPYAPDTDNLPAAFTALDRMQRSLKELDAAREAAKAAAAQRELLSEHLPLQAEPLADPIPEPEQSPEEIARQLPTLQASRRELQSQLDRLLGQIRAIGSPDELRTRLQEDETRLTALRQEYDAIALAMQALSAANTTLQNRFSPALGARAAEIFAALSGGRYDKVLLSRDFALSAEPSGDAAARSIQLLSQGTADQLYLAVRLAICEMVLPADRKSPLILDDALANFDDDRLAAALDWLLIESTSRQILLFTCQNRESAYLAGREGVHFLTLETPI